ncbi:MAG TPA: SDR family NAD(P)-dependent oxidoreductase [Candidatus Dormibacteraeota bacterium]|nr:SDR family NAD(P)-dependent oxidoreductase [Candidatus Dormibacteraeota bacterium]
MRTPAMEPARTGAPGGLMRLDRRTYVVTGANRGLGFEVAVSLADLGADVVLAVRDLEAGQKVADTIRTRHPAATPRVLSLDLARLESVRAFVDELDMDSVDGLVCNAAAIMVGPGRTMDGFEMHWGVNHLGHFALAATLMPALLRAPAARVVMVTSLLARWGRIPQDPTGMEARYRSSRAYAASKLANLVFGLELSRRAESGGSRLISVVAHPGYARSGERAQAPTRRTLMVTSPIRLISQSAEAGALPIVRAAADQDLASGSLVGPSGLLGTRGTPKVVPIFSRAKTTGLGERLWTQAEAVIGLSMPGFDRGAGPG